MVIAPTRPNGVPAAARYLPPADSFAELQELHEQRPDKRQYLRVSFRFVVIDFTGVRLTDVRPRFLGISKRTWSMGRALIFNGSEQTPEVWAWTLADERCEVAS